MINNSKIVTTNKAHNKGQDSLQYIKFGFYIPKINLGLQTECNLDHHL